MSDLRTRRAVLATLGATALAGCAGGDDPSSGNTDDSAGRTGRRDTTAADDTADLDLREANVVGVEVAGDGDRLRFDVTLHHDDEGEDGYADWWQVERPDETRLGRRELLHAHAQQPFTRSDSYDLPADVSCVVVRGHDETHGYGGRAMLVDLESGTTTPVDQGAERQPVQPADCPP